MSDDMKEARERARKRAAAKAMSEHAKARQDNLEKIKKEAAEKQKIFEQERQAELKRIRDEEIARLGKPRKVFVSGDTRGNLTKLFTTIEAQVAKVGAFEALFCVGSFMPENEEGGMFEYTRKQKKVPLATYFVDTSAALVQSSPKGREICENLHFLGGYGVKDICGLRVAFLSGYYDPDKYDTPDVDFVGGAYTSRAVAELKKVVTNDKKRRGIDVFLTAAWPEGIDQKIEAANLKPPELPDSPKWQSASAAPLAELCLVLEPRYFVFGSADLFYQRPPFQVKGRGHICRCIGLGKVGSTGKLRKWLHALSLSPMQYMKQEELKKLPEGSTPCPFVAQKRPATDPPAGEPAAKRRATAEEDSSKFSAEEAIAALSAGNFAAFQGFASRALGGVVADGNATPEELPEPVVQKKYQVTGKAWLDEDDIETEEERLRRTQAACGRRLQFDDLHKKEEGAEDKPLTEEEIVARDAAKEVLGKDPPKGQVRFSFHETGSLGIRLSRDVPPWVLEVRDGTLAARKAPRVPIGGIVVAVNGYDLSLKENPHAIKALANRPVVMDIEWPVDQALPSVKYA
eukprot:TRINITY_DN36245_c0_g1_i1.p1 TRINITY_DN36245_c0_g1~~TRINITY_DN36245_c0_g1_i1.p1  ORF type:complete len:597 (+),score=141.34 TRINITY_DN36245_c0_g1_i1:75-1793(+)